MSIYVQTDSFDLPDSGDVFDVLADGRLITSDGTTVKAETSLQSRQFSVLGTFVTNAPTFLKVSPNTGAIAAVGFWSNIDKKVYFFKTSDASQARPPINADNFDSEWISPTQLALTAEPPTAAERAIVTVMDTVSGVVKTVVKNAGEASGGVTIDLAGASNLFVGDGYSADGNDITGQIKAFPKADWINALAMGTPIDFDTTGTLVATILSAATLGFDKYGNLHVGGGDVTGGTDKGYAAVISKAALDAALAGGPPVTSASPPSDLQRIDPSPADNFWLVYSNRVTGELYLNDAGKRKVYVFELAKQ